MGSMNQGSLRFPLRVHVGRAFDLARRQVNIHLGKKLAGLLKIEIVRSLTDKTPLAGSAAFR